VLDVRSPGGGSGPALTFFLVAVWHLALGTWQVALFADFSHKSKPFSRIFCLAACFPVQCHGGMVQRWHCTPHRNRKLAMSTTVEVGQ